MRGDARTSRWAAVGIGVAAFVVLAPVVIGILGADGSLLIFDDAANGTTDQCVSAPTHSGQAASIRDQQLANARTIAAVTHEVGMPGAAARVAIIAAVGESDLLNLGYGDTAGPDSRGLFQQRTGWGSLEQRTDPATATRLFLLGPTLDGVSHGHGGTGLAGIADWDQMTATVAIHRVQVNADPNHYSHFEDRADQLIAAADLDLNWPAVPAPITATPTSSVAGAPSTNSAADTIGTGTSSCGTGGGEVSCPPSGLAAEQGLLPDTLTVLRCVKYLWPQITTFGGVGDRPSNVDDDHQTGRAVDAMLPTPYSSTQSQQLGKQIADWAVANHTALGLHYVIFDARIWSQTYPGAGWRNCGNPAACYSGTDDTLAHRDHVHVSTYGDSATGQPHRTGAAGPGTANHDASTNRDASDNSDGTVPGGRGVAPVGSYVLTARFGATGAHWFSRHTGLDFAAPAGRPIRAVLGGTVVAAGPCGCWVGDLTRIRIDPHTEIWFAHQSQVVVAVGERVAAGQVIGAVGSTGNVAGPHLHLERRVDGTPVDPEPWLRSIGAL